MPKILLVEDDSNLREIYGARLEAEGYQIFSASDGEEALATAVKEQPDLVISDVMMPKISGFDMLDIPRQTPETRNVKVIVMTALSQDEDRERGEKLGADRYVVKSQVTLDDVVAMVHDILEDGGGSAAATPNTAEDAGSPQPQTQTEPTNPELKDEVADFVATSPLMSGSAPAQTPVDPVATDDNQTDQSAQPQQ